MSEVRSVKTWWGGETWSHELLMMLKAYGTSALLIFGFLHLPLWICLSMIFADTYWFWYLDDYFFAFIRTGVSPAAMVSVTFDGSAKLYSAAEVKEVLGPRLWSEAVKVGILGALSSVVYVATGPYVIKRFRKRAEEISETRHVRGADLITPEKLIKEMLMNKEETDLRIGEVEIPVRLETQHVYVVGTTGAGKTALLSQVLNRLRRRGDRGIIYDYKGDYVQRFYDPDQGDILFNPLDNRSVPWDIFTEVRTIVDLDSIAHSLIPSASVETDRYWTDAARDVFLGILHYLWQSGKRTNQDLWDALTASASDIQGYLRQTSIGRAALKHIDDPGSKQTQGVLGCLIQYTKGFSFLGATGDFSFTEWVRNGKGWIFIANTAQVKDTLKPTLSLAIDIVARETLSLSDNRDRRMFVMIDEFGTLQRLNSLVDLLTLSRSKGGSLWLGTQDFGRVTKLYGKEIAETIANNCSTVVSFRINSPETSEYLSRLFGEREISKVDESFSMGPEDMRDGLSLARKEKIEKIILPSQIQGLPNLHCFLKVGYYRPVKTHIEYRDFPVRNEALVLRDDVYLDKEARNTVNEGESNSDFFDGL